MAQKKKVDPVPVGMPTLVPYLTVPNAAQAIEFYKKSFGAEERGRMLAPDKKSVWHATLQIGNSLLFLADESVSMGGRSAKTLGGTPVALQLNVVDADATFTRATAAGAKVTMPLADMFWGDRYGHLTDPFGLTWAISTHIKDLTPEEMAEAAEAAADEWTASK